MFHVHILTTDHTDKKRLRLETDQGFEAQGEQTYPKF